MKTVLGLLLSLLGPHILQETGRLRTISGFYEVASET